jgi:hypothetical protein
MSDGLQEIDIQASDRVVFVHIPKTAGESFAAVLDPLLSGLPRLPKESLETGAGVAPEDVASYQFFASHVTYDAFDTLLPGGFLMLTVLRDPVQRTISHYQHLQRIEDSTGSPPRDYELRKIKAMTLEEFVVNDTYSEARIAVNLQTWMLGGVDPRVVRDPFPGALACAKQRLERAAFFGLTERFQDSLFLLSFVFGWPPIPNSLALNRAPASGRSPELNPRTLSLIKERVDLDLELYEFARELFERRFRAMTRRLLQQYGDGRHPDPQSPLPDGTIVALLEKHYDARRTRRQQAWVTDRGASYLYLPSSPSEGAFGWYPLDVSPLHGPVRWSGPGLQSTLDLPCPRGGKIRVSFRMVMALQPDVADGLTLTANGTPVTLTRVSERSGPTVFSGTIPVEATAKPFVRLVFSVPRTVAACSVDPSNRDERPLGILLNWVKLEGTEDAPGAANATAVPGT